MTTFFKIANNAVGLVKNNPLALGDTNLVVDAALDSKLSGIGFPFHLTLWTAGLNPSTDPNVEIVNVTARPSANNYTITRAQEGTTAVAHAFNDNVGLLWTKALVDELETAINANVPYTGATANVDLGAYNLSLNKLHFSTSPTVGTPANGDMYWNSTDNTVDIVVDATNGVTLQLGHEQYVRIVNKTGVQINDGQVVYINGAQGNRPTVALARANAFATSSIIGVATQNIADNAEGNITTFGVIHNYNTSGFAAGDTLYLSPTTPGLITNVAPSSPNYVVMVGKALDSTNNGHILILTQPPLDTDGSLGDNSDLVAPTEKAVKTYVDTNFVNKTQNTLTKEPTGFTDPANVTVSYDSATRQVTLTGTVAAYYQGAVVSALVSGWVSSAHTATTGPWFLYYNGSFVWSQTPWTYDTLQIAYINYGASDKFGIREPHGLMQWQAHKEYHQTVGTYWGAGGDLAGYTLSSTTAANRRPTVSATTVNDEDLTTVNALLNSSLYTRYYLTSTGVGNFSVDQTDIVSLSTNQPYYNQFTGGVWQQTLMSAGQYQAIWVMAVPTTSDTTSQKYRYIWIQGQTQGNLATIQGLTTANVNLGDFTTLATEFTFIAKIIIQYTAGNWVLTQVDKITGSKLNQTTTTGGVYLSAVSTNGGLTGDGSAANPLVVSGVTLAMLSNLAANSVIGNATGSPATPTAISMVSTATASSVALRDANANLTANNTLNGYTTTATAAGITTLTVSSTYQQYFTGSTTQTVVMPVTSTLVLGQSWNIVNNSTGSVTVNSSGANTICTITAGSSATVTCILTSGTTNTSWSYSLIQNSAGYVTSIGVTTANGVSGTSSGGSTPSLTITLGAITPTSVSPTSFINVATGQEYRYNGLPIARGITSKFNWFFGNAGNLVTTGSYNTAVGDSALISISSGSYNSNSAFGFGSLLSLTAGSQNTAVGSQALGSVGTGSNNTAVGMNALYAVTGSGSGNVALGNYAGKYETGSNAFYIDNQDRTNTAGDKAGALLYGTFNATASSQTLKVNGVLTLAYVGTAAGSAVSVDGTQTITNKRSTKRLVSVTQAATPAVNTDNTDIASITGLAQDITSMTTNLTGTPVNGDMIMFQITDNATPRLITWGASFANTTNYSWPTTTVASTLLRALGQWNSTTSKWECVG